MSKGELINIGDIKSAARVLRAVNHTLRQEILLLLNKNQKLPVIEIYSALKILQSDASSHLRILKEAGIVDVERDGKFRFYYIVPERLEKVNEYAKALIGIKN